MRVLVTGASGLLGSAMVKIFQNKFNVYATSKSDCLGYKPKNFKKFNLHETSYFELLNWAKPDIIVHNAAITDLDFCEKNEDLAFEVNAHSLKKFLSYSQDIKIIFISSDAVFPLKSSMSKENDALGPINVYGLSKLKAEEILIKSKINYTIIRTTIVGLNENIKNDNFVSWIIKSGMSGKKITLFNDAVFNPISVWDLIRELEFIIFKEMVEVLHISGSETISKYEFGKKICSHLNLNSNFISSGSIKDFNFLARRSSDQTLDCSLYEKISGRKLPNVKDTIKSITKFYRSGLDEQFQNWER